MFVDVPLPGFGTAHLHVTNGARPRDVRVVQLSGVLGGKTLVAVLALEVPHAFVDAFDVIGHSRGPGERLRTEGTREHTFAVFVCGEDGLSGRGGGLILFGALDLRI